MLVLDFLFDKRGATAIALSRDKYPRHMNCRSDHGLSDVALRTTLDRLTRLGMVVEGLRPVSGDRGFRLTALGGQVWEDERRPDWSRYCFDLCGEDEAGQERLSVTCSHVSVGRAFTEVAVACNLYDLDREALRVIPEAEDSLVYWRCFSPVWSLSGPSSRTDGPCDWEYYERHRTWWRTLNELISKS